MPTADEMEEAKVSSRTLAKYADTDRVGMMLRVSNGKSGDLVLPAHVLQELLTVLPEMSQGSVIIVLPRHQELSTQDAASILNVSRPFLAGILEKGEIPHCKVGSHRRVRLADVLAYKEHVDEQRIDALNELNALSQ